MYGVLFCPRYRPPISDASIDDDDLLGRERESRINNKGAATLVSPTSPTYTVYDAIRNKSPRITTGPASS